MPPQVYVAAAYASSLKQCPAEYMRGLHGRVFNNKNCCNWKISHTKKRNILSDASLLLSASIHEMGVPYLMYSVA